MIEFLQALIAFPTVLFTVPLAVTLFYWLFVIAGAADVDSFDGVLEGIDGLAEGAVEGVAEGVAEGAAEGVAEGLAEGAAEGAMEGAAEAGAEGAAGLIAFLRMRSVPITVWFSLFSLIGWAICFFGSELLGPIMDHSIPRWAFGSLLFLTAFVGGSMLTSAAVRPLETIFKHESVRAQRNIVGREVVILTGSVDAKFGQAEFADGHAGLLLSVRCTTANNKLKKGDTAIIIDYDDDDDVYMIEPSTALLAERTESPPQTVPASAVPEKVASATDTAEG